MSTANTAPVRKKNNSEAVLLGVLGAIIVLGGGLFFLLSKLNDPTGGKPPPTVQTTLQKFETIVKAARHERGVTNAPLTIVEFADAECPHCRRAYNDVVKTFETRNDIRFMFLHKPFPDMHPTAMPAALAMEAANKQGKFWQMYDALFLGKETKLPDSYIEKTAKNIGLNMDQFRKDWKDKEARINVEKDVALSEDLGIKMTPTFIVHRAGSKNVIQTTEGAKLKELIDNPDKAEADALKTAGQ